MALIRRFGIELIAILCMAVCIQKHLVSKEHSNFVASDGKGYYGYLPAVFVYKDPAFNFIKQYEANYYGPESYFDFRNNTDEGKIVNKYFSGLAILWAPFFLMAHLLAFLLHLPADGYSLVYQLSVPVAMGFYLYLGLKALFKLLLSFNVAVLPAFLTICFTLLATNLLYYVVLECSMTHAYSFSLICIFAYCLFQICNGKHPKWILFGIVTLGLIVAIRPVNLMVIGLLPVMAGSKERLILFFRRTFANYKYLLSGILLATVPFIIQMSLWHWQTGHWIVYAYKDENFIWNRPAIYQVLFSYRKGWFLYTPFALIGVLGLVYWLKKDAFRGISALIQLILILYVVSCWWSWGYGMGFGHRAMIDFLILPALGFHTLICADKILRRLAITLSIVCLTINVIQTYQYKRYILLWDGMNKDAYWKVFLKTSTKYHGILWGDLSESTHHFKNNIRNTIYQDFENTASLGNNPNISNEWVHSGKNACIVDKAHSYSPGIEIALQPCDSMVQASVWFRNNRCENSVLGTTIYRKGKVVYYKDSRFLLFWFKNKQWTEAVLHAPIPVDMQKGDTMKVFVWNADSRERVAIDDMKADIITKTKCP